MWKSWWTVLFFLFTLAVAAKHPCRAAQRTTSAIDTLVVEVSQACQRADSTVRSAEIEGAPSLDADVLRQFEICEFDSLSIRVTGTRQQIDRAREEIVNWLASIGPLNSCDSITDCADTGKKECIKNGCQGANAVSLTANSKSTYNGLACEAQCFGCGGANKTVTRLCIRVEPIVR